MRLIYLAAGCLSAAAALAAAPGEWIQLGTGLIGAATAVWAFRLDVQEHGW